MESGPRLHTLLISPWRGAARDFPGAISSPNTSTDGAWKITSAPSPILPLLQPTYTITANLTSSLTLKIVCNAERILVRAQ